MSEPVIFVTHRRNAAAQLPDGQISKKLSSPLAKNISLSPSGKSVLTARPVLSRQGADRASSRTRDGMRWTRQRRRARWSQGGSLIRERFTARGTNGAVLAFGETRRTCTKPGEAFGEDGLRTAKPCGPGTRCWCQVREGEVAQPGRPFAVNSLTTVTRRIRRRGEHGISRQAIAQGMPDCLR
jgi:hypothetical protein